MRKLKKLYCNKSTITRGTHFCHIIAIDSDECAVVHVLIGETILVLSAVLYDEEICPHEWAISVLDEMSQSDGMWMGAA